MELSSEQRLFTSSTIKKSYSPAARFVKDVPVCPLSQVIE